jgi:streptogramin lyase
MTRRQATEPTVLGRGCPASPCGAGLALTAQAVPPFGQCAARALALSLRHERGGEFGMEQGASPFCCAPCVGRKVWYVQNATKGEDAVTTR